MFCVLCVFYIQTYTAAHSFFFFIWPVPETILEPGGVGGREGGEGGSVREAEGDMRSEERKKRERRKNGSRVGVEKGKAEVGLRMQ